MVHLTHTVSGDMIGAALADDPEETAEALLALADNADLGEVREYLDNLPRRLTDKQLRRMIELGTTIVDAMKCPG